jgi:hypothetical protein
MGVSTMRSTLNGIVLVLLAAALPGCPFESKVPLSRPTARPVDSRLTGFWVWDDPDDRNNAALLLVKPFNDSEYLVELQGGKDAEPTHFRAYAFEVGDQLYWSANEVSTTFPPRRWVFTRCVVTDEGGLRFRFVGEKKVPKSLESDADGLMALLRAHLGDTLLDDTEKGLYEWRRPIEGEVVKGRLARFAGSNSPGADASGR